MKAHSAIIAVVVCAGSVPAMAQMITNPSFEDGPEIDNGWRRVLGGSNELDGWFIDRGNIDIVNTQWWASIGRKSIDLNGNARGRMGQVLETTPGVQYVVDFALSGNWGGIATKTLRVTAGDYTQLYQVDTSQNTWSNMHWTDTQFVFTATKNITTIRFASQNRGFYGAAIDDVRITAVPAPASAALLGLGLLGGRRRRR